MERGTGHGGRTPSCPQCGTPRRGTFCGWCGYDFGGPTPTAAEEPPPRRSWWPVAIAAVVAVLVGGAGAAALLVPRDTWDSARYGGPSTDPHEPHASSTVTVEEREPATQTHTEVIRQPRTSTSTTTVYEEKDDEYEEYDYSDDSYECSDGNAFDTLEARRDDTWSTLFLDDRWVLQLDSKYSGVVDPRVEAANGSHTFYNSDICEVQGDKAEAWDGGAFIHHVRASDFGETQTEMSDQTWVLLVDPYEAGGSGFTKDEAQQACEDYFPSLSGDDLANECVPRKLTAP